MKNSCTLLFCVFFYSTFSQAVFRTYSDHSFNHITRIPGNEMLLTGNHYSDKTSKIWRLQANGDTIWSLHLADEMYVRTSGINMLPDGNYLSYGVVRIESNLVRPSFRRINPTGQVIATVHHSLPRNFSLEKVHLLPDHTFLGVGTTGYSVPYNYAQLHLDSTLENILSFTEHQIEEDTLIYNGQNMISSYLDAEQQMVVSLTNDIISGPNVNSDAWVIKSDVDGEIIWKIQLDYNQTDFAEDVMVLPDKSVLVSGHTGENVNLRHKLFLTKMDSSGAVISERILADSSMNVSLFGSLVLPTADGDLVMVGIRIDSFKSDILVILLDADGIEKNRVVLERENYDDYAGSIAWLDDGVLAIAGLQRHSFNVANNLLILFPFSLLTFTKEVVFENEQFQVFPNPFETEVSIQYNEPNAKKEALRLDVYSSSGMKIYEGAVINRIYLQHLPAGMYYFILTDRSLSKSFVRKVAKR